LRSDLQEKTQSIEDLKTSHHSIQKELTQKIEKVTKTSKDLNSQTESSLREAETTLRSELELIKA